MTSGDRLELTWYGQSMFRLAGGGLTLVCDPTDPQTGYTYDPVTADLVLLTHQHYDHSFMNGVKGNPLVIRKPGTTDAVGLEVTGIRTFHDASGGKQRGENIIFTWEQAGLRLAHLGDLGEIPGPEELAPLKGLDMVMVPVGGVFTIDAGQAVGLISDLAPRVVFPMHYGTPACNIPLDPLDEFTGRFGGPVRDQSVRPLAISSGSLPVSTEAWVVPYQSPAV